MREAIAIAGLLVLATGVAALHAVLDGRRAGVPASIAVLGPAAETARLLRTRAVGARRGARPVVGGALLLASPIVRVLTLPVASMVLGAPAGLAWLVVADVLWWAGAGAIGGRSALRAAAAEAPMLLALAAPAAAARSLLLGAAITAQVGQPFGLEAPVALLLLLAIGGVLQPWAVRPVVAATGGTARLLGGAALAAQPVATAAIATVLFLGDDVGAGRFVLLVVVLTAVLVLVARRFPVLLPARIARLALTVLLPLAAVQLAIVVVLSLLS